MIFLWPAPRFHATSLMRLAEASTVAVEGTLRSSFSGGEPVFVSSARAGIALTLEMLGAARADLVALPPYASHCLVEAVARRATPLASGAEAQAAYDIVYHQWGHVQARARAGGTLFEDACDTLCRRGAALFPLGGEFEFWSLPKIAACSSGGVVWCRDLAQAAGLRALRGQHRPAALLQWTLRRAGSRWAAAAEYWAGREAAGGAASRITCAEALHVLQRWDRIVEQREKRVEAVRACWPAWLSPREDRLPCALPVRDEPEARDALRRLAADIGPRHYERVRDTGSELVKVLPVPLHEDMDVTRLRQAAATFRVV
jgi:putative PLP-dependent aminotransferase (TIGR04422 family)